MSSTPEYNLFGGNNDIISINQTASSHKHIIYSIILTSTCPETGVNIKIITKHSVGWYILKKKYTI